MYFKTRKFFIREEAKKVLERIIFIAEKYKQDQPILGLVENDRICDDLAYNKAKKIKDNDYSTGCNLEQKTRECLENIYHSYFSVGTCGYDWQNGNSNFHHLVELLKTKTKKKYWHIFYMIITHMTL